MITAWEVRGAKQNSRHRATALSMVTASKERPSSSGLSIDTSSRLETRVAGVPKAGIGVDDPMSLHFASSLCWRRVS